MINRKTKVKQSCKNELQIETKRLKALLKFYKEKDSLAVVCLNELNPIMDEIHKGNTDKPYEQIPCARYLLMTLWVNIRIYLNVILSLLILLKALIVMRLMIF